MAGSVNRVHKGMKVGEILESVPGAKGVLERFFGVGCFSCPSVNDETVEFGSIMHGVDSDQVVEALNKLLENQ